MSHGPHNCSECGAAIEPHRRGHGRRPTEHCAGCFWQLRERAYRRLRVRFGGPGVERREYVAHRR